MMKLLRGNMFRLLKSAVFWISVAAIFFCSLWSITNFEVTTLKSPDDEFQSEVENSKSEMMQLSFAAALASTACGVLPFGERT